VEDEAMIDLHVHTWRCRHAVGTAEEYVRAAAERGISVLGFTEHLPLAPALAANVPGAEGYAMPAEELADYMAEVHEAAEVGRELGVEVLCGVEVDLVPVALEHARSSLQAVAFDVVLGSVHFIDGWAFDDPARTGEYDRWDTTILWERYFADLAAAAGTGIADVMAHADLIKKFCRVPPGPLDSLYRETARVLAGAGVAVEVNTAGLRKPCREIYPGPELLRELARAGVPVTVGSDAHDPSEVGFAGEAARTALADAGYRSVLVYRGRVPEEVPLDAW
jgi:histidinol-phosphatase (PHP family)